MDGAPPIRNDVIVSLLQSLLSTNGMKTLPTISELLTNEYVIIIVVVLLLLLLLLLLLFCYYCCCCCFVIIVVVVVVFSFFKDVSSAVGLEKPSLKVQ